MRLAHFIDIDDIKGVLNGGTRMPIGMVFQINSDIFEILP